MSAAGIIEKRFGDVRRCASHHPPQPVVESKSHTILHVPPIVPPTILCHHRIRLDHVQLQRRDLRGHAHVAVDHPAAGAPPDVVAHVARRAVPRRSCSSCSPASALPVAHQRHGRSSATAGPSALLHPSHCHRPHGSASTASSPVAYPPGHAAAHAPAPS